MTDEEKTIKIEEDCEVHANNLISRSYTEKNNESIATQGIEGLIGKTKTIKTTTIKASETKEIEVKADGTVVKTSDIISAIIE